MILTPPPLHPRNIRYQRHALDAGFSTTGFLIIWKPADNQPKKLCRTARWFNADTISTPVKIEPTTSRPRTTRLEPVS